MTPDTAKTIGILIPTLHRGGAEKQAALLAASLRPYFRVYMIVMCPSRGMDPDIIRLSTLPDDNIIRLKGNTVGKFIRLREFLRYNSVDTLFCYLTRADLLGPIAGRQAGVRRIYQGVRNSALPVWKQFLERIGALRADGIIFNSMAGLRRLSKLTSGRAIMIRNRIDDSSVTPLRCADIPAGKVIVVTSSRFVPYKGYKTAIEAMQRAMSPESDPEERLHWLILGQGPLEHRIRRRIEKLGIAGRVTMKVGDPKALHLMAGCDIYFSASRLEGMPNSIMEAMAAGLPVVATDAGDSAILVGAGGLISPVGDTAGLAASLKRLAYDPELRQQLGRQGESRVHELCMKERFLSSYLNLLKEGIPEKIEGV